VACDEDRSIGEPRVRDPLAMKIGKSRDAPIKGCAESVFIESLTGSQVKSIRMAGRHLPG
jgi:hypothetical protein